MEYELKYNSVFNIRQIFILIYTTIYMYKRKYWPHTYKIMDGFSQ